MVFLQNLLENAYFIAKMRGLAMVRPASSDLWKALPKTFKCKAYFDQYFYGLFPNSFKPSRVQAMRNPLAKLYKLWGLISGDFLWNVGKCSCWKPTTHNKTSCLIRRRLWRSRTHLLGPVPERPISVNPGLKFLFRFCILHSYALHLVLKAQQYFVSSSYMFLYEKTVLEIWLNPGLNLTVFWGTGLWWCNTPVTSDVLCLCRITDHLPVQ